MIVAKKSNFFFYFTALFMFIILGIFIISSNSYERGISNINVAQDVREIEFAKQYRLYFEVLTNEKRMRSEVFKEFEDFIKAVEADVYGNTKEQELDGSKGCRIGTRTLWFNARYTKESCLPAFIDLYEVSFEDTSRATLSLLAQNSYSDSHVVLTPIVSLDKESNIITIEMFFALQKELESSKINVEESFITMVDLSSRYDLLSNLEKEIPKIQDYILSSEFKSCSLTLNEDDCISKALSKKVEVVKVESLSDDKFLGLELNVQDKGWSFKALAVYSLPNPSVDSSSDT